MKIFSERIMKTWTMLAGGAVMGAVLTAAVVGVAQGDTGDTGRIAALEARLARMEQAVATGDSVTVTANKRLILTAGDEIWLGTGKARLQMKKSGEIVLSGTDITIDGAGKINVKSTSDVTVKGRKIAEN
ncbi:rhs element Vgr protein [Asticcacaulis biprosthecium C19]|uniref:Rhs element Vgr protein n=2 Tax=Asticcacaulis biprosthecium TaxID=76891 RepID=F4QTS4_9CAUL|nr:rhs element Vgr protein [Asticcacaulis biprosthecium C19]